MKSFKMTSKSYPTDTLPINIILSDKQVDRLMKNHIKNDHEIHNNKVEIAEFELINQSEDYQVKNETDTFNYVYRTLKFLMDSEGISSENISFTGDIKTMAWFISGYIDGLHQQHLYNIDIEKRVKR